MSGEDRPNFVDEFVSREHRFSLGTETRSGRRFLSTPVSGFNRAAEYEEYYAISEEDYARFRASPETADGFTEDCRMGRTKDRIFRL